MTLEGRLQGQLSGQWSDRMKQFEAAGELKVSQGMMGWEYGVNMISTTLQSVEVSWNWRVDQLRGNLSFNLGEVGRLKGNFILPLGNNLPTSVRDKGPIRLSLEGQFEERGLLPTFFPNLVQGSHGKVDFGLLANGTWEKPNLKGSLRFTKTKFSLLAGNLKGHDKKGNLSADKILKVSLDRGQVQFGWDGKMLQGMGEFELMPACKLRASLSSFQPPWVALHKQFKLNASWEAFDLNFLRSWLPNEMVLKGQLFGSLSGQYSNHRFDTTGEIRISQDEVGWKYETGSLNAILRRAKMTWSWKDDDLRGEIAINLVDYGQVEGNFQLHLPPHYPIVINPKGPIRFFINGQFKEKGLIPAFFPGVVQESQGQIHLNLKGNGTWERPNLQGSMKLEKGGCYIPASGIRLKEMSIEAQFRGDHIRITSFKTHSGPGHLEGDATIWFEDWKVSRYEGNLRGDRFQTLHLPEMQVLSNPHLDFHGTPQRLVVRGEIILPDLLISGSPTKDVVRPSPDVIIVDAPEVVKPKFPPSCGYPGSFASG
ncbi:MAG: translocation/assembly module TamB domain-containing protein [Thermodesulfobacteriota bacterium]